MKFSARLCTALLSLFSITTIHAQTAAPNSLAPEQLQKRRADYARIVTAAETYKTGVMRCAQDLHSLKNCNAGTNHIPTAITMPIGQISSLNVISGVITITPATVNGFVPADTYVLVPTISESGDVSWEVSGGALIKGYVDK